MKTKSFDLVIYRDGKEFTFKSTGQELTPEMINNLKKLKSGDSFFFDNIYVNLPDGVRQNARLEGGSQMIITES